MTLEILAIAAMFLTPVLLSVVALTGETSPRGLLQALMNASRTGYAEDMDDIPSPR